jgi:pimeloyl-ACP methyl ester carboxylesterase
VHRAPIGDIALEYEIRGNGEPVVLIHAGVCAGFFVPLVDEPALSGYRLIRYHRAGYAGSGHVDGALSLREQATHCRRLMRHLGVARAHVVGHSSGATIALQFALDHPDAVRTLALLEPALLAVPSGAFAAEAMRHYGAGDLSAAVDVWMRGVGGPDYRSALDRAVPGAVDRAATDADTFFGQELPAVREWTFGPDEAARIRSPTLLVLGARSDDVSPAFRRRHELLLDWLPAAEPFVLADANHLLQVQNPAGMAGHLARFFARHTG